MAAREVRLTARSHKLENTYNESLRATAISHEVENARRLRLKIVLLEQENDDLKELSWQHEEQIDDLHAIRDELTDEAAANARNLESTQIDLRAKSRQVDTLTAELQSMKGLSSDSSKILGEKLALSRELAALKPQMEHLQAQINANQNILAEKLSLQRELSAIQVELDNERRSSAKARVRDPEPSMEMGKINGQIDQLRAELAREKRERERSEREYNAKLEEAENNTKLMDSRVEAFRTKLKATKDQLKEAQDDLQTRNTKVSKGARLVDSPEKPITAAPLVRKRSAAQMDPDAALGTPGDHLPVKRGRRISTALAGEKSSFSITPFLNKTGDIASDSPTETPSRHAIESAAAARYNTDSDDSMVAVQPKKKSLVRTKTNDGPSLSRNGDKGTALKTKRSTEKLARKSTLDQVDEENDENEEHGRNVNVATVQKKGAAPGSFEVEKPALKKKRRLLGKTLFDDDEDITISRRDDSIFSRSGLSLGGKSLGKPGGGLGSRLPTKDGNSFAAFSPLKKDRSVLAG